MNESAQSIAAELRTRAPASLDTAREPSGIPTKPGFYAWWLADRSALPDVPLESEAPHLLYVGIAPSRPTSRATLRSRVLGNHVGGNLAASTFRRSLAALLWQQEKWTPYVTARGKLRFTREENAALTAWQHRNLLLSWAVVAEPWEHERDVIAELCPPLNVEYNAAHPFCKRMQQARAECVASAQPLRR
jgi:hypothetical protein